jgi:recombination protein RecA
MAKELSANEAFKQLEDLFGDDAIFHPKMVEEVETISTGSPSLDFSVGQGGIPRGRVTQFAGKEASGKTFLALQVAAQWQAKHPDNCFAFLDAEYTYDPKWAESFGIDNDRVFLVKSNQAENLFGGLVGKTKVHSTTKKETKVYGLFDMIENGTIMKYPHPDPDKNKMNTLDLSRCGLVILDSIAAMQPPMERTSNVGKQNMALMARFLSVELRKITPGAAKSNCAVIFINQLRVNPGQLFGNPEDSPGGRALKHACSLMINFAPLGGADNILERDGVKVGHRVRAKVLKNKIAPPGPRCEYFIEYMKGVVKKEEELLDIGNAIGYWERPGARSYMIDGVKYSSKADVLDRIREELPRFEYEIRAHYMDGGMSAEPTQEDDIEGFTPEDPFAD